MAFSRLESPSVRPAPFRMKTPAMRELRYADKNMLNVSQKNVLQKEWRKVNVKEHVNEILANNQNLD